MCGIVACRLSEDALPTGTGIGPTRWADSVVNCFAGPEIGVGIGGACSTVPALSLSVGTLLGSGMHRGGMLQAVVPSPSLARELAILLARDVDKPRSLAESVTVD